MMNQHSRVYNIFVNNQAEQLRKMITLTAREFAVLHALMLRRQHIVKRAQIEEALYGWGDEVESNAIEVHIHHLRKKLGVDTILTVRGLGYRLQEKYD